MSPVSTKKPEKATADDSPRFQGPPIPAVVGREADASTPPEKRPAGEPGPAAAEQAASSNVGGVALPGDATKAQGQPYVPGDGEVSPAAKAALDQAAHEPIGTGEIGDYAFDFDTLPTSLQHLMAPTDPPGPPLTFSKAIRRWLARFENSAKAAGNEEHKQFVRDAAAIIKLQAGISPDEPLLAVDPPSPYGPVDGTQVKLSSHDHGYVPWLPAKNDRGEDAEAAARRIDAERGTNLAETSNNSPAL